MFYDNLKAICDLKGLKITTVVTECGGALGSISKWRSGANPNSDIVIKLAFHLGVTTDYLLIGREDNLSTNENELLEIFKNFNDREQVKIIGRMEEWLEVKHQREAISKSQRIVGVQVARRTDGKFVKEPVTAEEMEKIKALPEDTDY
jgi:hypothetical protein